MRLTVVKMHVYNDGFEHRKYCSDSYFVYKVETLQGNSNQDSKLSAYMQTHAFSKIK